MTNDLDLWPPCWRERGLDVSHEQPLVAYADLEFPSMAECADAAFA